MSRVDPTTRGSKKFLTFLNFPFKSLSTVKIKKEKEMKKV